MFTPDVRVSKRSDKNNQRIDVRYVTGRPQRDIRYAKRAIMRFEFLLYVFNNIVLQVNSFDVLNRLTADVDVGQCP